MLWYQRVMIFAVAFGIMLLIFELVRKRRLREEYSWLWLLTHTLYRIKILGGEHIPARGGALLVANHVSYADPFVVGAALPRYVRYLMHRAWMERPGIGGFSAPRPRVARG